MTDFTDEDNKMTEKDIPKILNYWLSMIHYDIEDIGKSLSNIEEAVWQSAKNTSKKNE